MATKKKAEKKKAAKKKAITASNAGKNAAEIYILADGSVFPLTLPVDPDGVKHASKVFWQAMDTTKTYQIVLPNPPAPFKSVTLPIQTDASGATQTLKLAKDPNGEEYGYEVMELIKAKFHRTSAGGIIIDS